MPDALLFVCGEGGQNISGECRWESNFFRGLSLEGRRRTARRVGGGKNKIRGRNGRLLVSYFEVVLANICQASVGLNPAELHDVVTGGQASGRQSYDDGFPAARVFGLEQVLD